MKEANSHVIPLQTPGLHCYENHKFRNCQNLVAKDLTVSPVYVEMDSGGSTTVTIHNNTPANETLIRTIQNNANGQLTGLEQVGGNGIVRHYSTNQHLIDVQITYTAGDVVDPNGATDAFEVEAYGHTVNFQIFVRSKFPVRLQNFASSYRGPDVYGNCYGGPMKDYDFSAGYSDPGGRIAANGSNLHLAYQFQQNGCIHGSYPLDVHVGTQTIDFWWGFSLGEPYPINSDWINVSIWVVDESGNQISNIVTDTLYR